MLFRVRIDEMSWIVISILSGYARVAMLPFKLIYDHGYDLHLGAHVFPSQKYRLVREALLHEGSGGVSPILFHRRPRRMKTSCAFMSLTTSTN